MNRQIEPDRSLLLSRDLGLRPRAYIRDRLRQSIGARFFTEQPVLPACFVVPRFLTQGKRSVDRGEQICAPLTNGDFIGLQRIERARCDQALEPTSSDRS